MHSFQRRHIVDKRLPVTSLDRPQSDIRAMDLSNSAADGLATAFYEKQWLFCPILLFRNMSRFYFKEWIMPICRKQKINDKGGSGTGIYLIEVQEQAARNGFREGAVKYNNKVDHFGDVSGSRRFPLW